MALRVAFCVLVCFQALGVEGAAGEVAAAAAAEAAPSPRPAWHSHHAMFAVTPRVGQAPEREGGRP
jgi:hypothetical protein